MAKQPDQCRSYSHEYRSESDCCFLCHIFSQICCLLKRCFLWSAQTALVWRAWNSFYSFKWFIKLSYNKVSSFFSDAILKRLNQIKSLFFVLGPLIGKVPGHLKDFAIFVCVDVGPWLLWLLFFPETPRWSLRRLFAFHLLSFVIKFLNDCMRWVFLDVFGFGDKFVQLFETCVVIGVGASSLELGS